MIAFVPKSDKKFQILGSWPRDYYESRTPKLRTLGERNQKFLLIQLHHSSILPDRTPQFPVNFIFIHTEDGGIQFESPGFKHNE